MVPIDAPLQQALTSSLAWVNPSTLAWSDLARCWGMLLEGFYPWEGEIKGGSLI
jgi:hypothetical protein